MNDRVVDGVVAAAIAGAVGFTASLGFSGPKEKFVEHDKRLGSLESHASITDTTLARMDQKLDDLIEGLGIRHRRRNP